jgi:hypothetical protein
MAKRRATCSCGQLTADAEGEPIRISVCHCLACQQRTGSAFGVQARFPEASVRIEGRATSYVRTADSGHKLTQSFCPSCGATVYYTLDQVPGSIAIPVGAFADPTFPAPKISIYETRKHEWVAIAGDVEHLE